MKRNHSYSTLARCACGHALELLIGQRCVIVYCVASQGEGHVLEMRPVRAEGQSGYFPVSSPWRRFLEDFFEGF